MSTMVQKAEAATETVGVVSIISWARGVAKARGLPVDGREVVEIARDAARADAAKRRGYAGPKAKRDAAASDAFADALDAVLAEGEKAPYVIRINREFFGPSVKRSLLKTRDFDHGDMTATFSTRADAQAWIDATSDEPYYMQDSEAGRPSYTILRSDRLPAYLADEMTVYS